MNDLVTVPQPPAAPTVDATALINAIDKITAQLGKAETALRAAEVAQQQQPANWLGKLFPALTGGSIGGFVMLFLAQYLGLAGDITGDAATPNAGILATLLGGTGASGILAGIMQAAKWLNSVVPKALGK